MSTYDIPLNILVAEDCDDNRQTMVMLIQALGHQVVAEAKNGHEILSRTEELGEDKIDLYCSDASMLPGNMGGITCGQEAYRKWGIPSIIITGYDVSDLLDQLTEKEFIVALFKKPFESSLEFKVALYISQREKKRAARRKHEEGLIFAGILRAAQLEDTYELARERVYSLAANHRLKPHEVAEKLVDFRKEQVANLQEFLDTMGEPKKNLK